MGAKIIKPIAIKNRLKYNLNDPHHVRVGSPCLNYIPAQPKGLSEL
jgi:hypothetical protein